MKILLKTIVAFAIVLMISLTSCVTDSCTECTGISSNINDPTETFDTLICLDQFDSRSDYENLITLYEDSFEATCTEQ